MWNSIEADPFKKGAAYFVGTRYKSDDFTPYIYKTEDYGKTWKLITNGIDKMHFTRVRADQKTRRACCMQEPNMECISVMMMAQLETISIEFAG